MGVVGPRPYGPETSGVVGDVAQIAAGLDLATKNGSGRESLGIFRMWTNNSLEPTACCLDS